MKIISFRNDVLPLKNELYRLAPRITLNNAEAEDIVQETLIKVWNKREEWQQIDSIEAFSMTVCRNLALDSLKRKSNDNDTLDENNTAEIASSSSPYEQMLQKDRI